MKKTLFISIALLLLLAIACVQKSYQRTVIFMLDISGMKEIQTVGLRGEGKHLSWDTDLTMKPLKKDSLYTATLTAITGYKFAEIKFVINGKFELENQPNRRVFFNGDTTIYKAKFNVIE